MTSANFQIVRARAEDASRLTEIALAAKRHWRYPEHWIEIWRPALTITPAYVSTEPVFAAEDGGTLAGFYGFLHKENALWLEHLWVLPARMGHGIGRALFQHAMETASSLGTSVVMIESDPHAELFYVHMGAQRIGEINSEIEGQRRILPLLQVRPQDWLATKKTNREE